MICCACYTSLSGVAVKTRLHWRNRLKTRTIPHQVEDVLEKRMESNLHHAMHSSHALQTVADGLPALGIVAAVLGVIKTMGAIDQPPEILGELIGGALVGTFMGVFLAYGFVGPFAARVKSVTEEDNNFDALIREVLVANLYNHATNICIEVGRQNTIGGPCWLYPSRCPDRGRPAVAGYPQRARDSHRLHPRRPVVRPVPGL